MTYLVVELPQGKTIAQAVRDYDHVGELANWLCDLDPFKDASWSIIEADSIQALNAMRDKAKAAS